MTPEEDEALRAHLYLAPPINGRQYKSSFMAALLDARAVAGRDRESGLVRPGERSATWLAALGYLVLLDHVGTCFARADCKPLKPFFIHALRCFSHEAHDATLCALYAVRNSLAHDFALFNPNPGNPLMNHAFIYAADEVSPLVQLPGRPWSGDYDRIPQDEFTLVNLREVGNLAEEVVARLRRDHQEGLLMIQPTLPEFRVRYGLYYQV